MEASEDVSAEYDKHNIGTHVSPVQAVDVLDRELVLQHDLQYLRRRQVGVV